MRFGVGEACVQGVEVCAPAGHSGVDIGDDKVRNWAASEVGGQFGPAVSNGETGASRQAATSPSTSNSCHLSLAVRVRVHGAIAGALSVLDPALLGVVELAGIAKLGERFDVLR